MPSGRLRGVGRRGAAGCWMRVVGFVRRTYRGAVIGAAGCSGDDSSCADTDQSNERASVQLHVGPRVPSATLRRRSVRPAQPSLTPVADDEPLPDPEPLPEPDPLPDPEPDPLPDPEPEPDPLPSFSSSVTSPPPSSLPHAAVRSTTAAPVANARPNRLVMLPPLALRAPCSLTSRP